MDDICKLKDIYKELYLFEKQFAKKHGISINEAMILCCLKDGIPKAANDLCRFIGLSNSRVSRIISVVENKQFINREMCNKDKRQMIFSLSDKGLEKIEQMQSQNIDFEELTSKIKNLIYKKN